MQASSLSPLGFHSMQSLAGLAQTLRLFWIFWIFYSPFWGQEGSENDPEP